MRVISYKYSIKIVISILITPYGVINLEFQTTEYSSGVSVLVVPKTSVVLVVSE